MKPFESPYGIMNEADIKEELEFQELCLLNHEGLLTRLCNHLDREDLSQTLESNFKEIYDKINDIKSSI